MTLSAARWTWAVGLLAGAGVALVLFFVFAFGLQGEAFDERHFAWLFWVNVAVAALLATVIGAAMLRLAVRLRRGKFGSRLLVKLAGIFALVGVLPGLVIYTVSYQFASRSIEAWFDLRVAGALDAGLSLGKTTLDVLAGDLVTKTRVAAERLADAPVGPLTLERAREQLGASELLLLGSGGQPLASAASAGARADPGPPPRAPPALLRQARQLGSASAIEGLDEDTLQPGGTPPRLRALVRVPRRAIELSAADERWLMALQPLPRPLAANALAVQEAYSEYQQRALARDSLRRMYIGTLTLALVLAIFAAVLLAIVLGNQLARPLLLLADGVRQVASGDLTAKPVFASRDELGGLTRSFAAMTAQLADAREQVQRGLLQLDGARRHLQAILDTVSAGVIVLDSQGLVETVNPAASQILQHPVEGWQGRRLSDLPQPLGALAQGIEQRLARLAAASDAADAADAEPWQESVELARDDGSHATLLLRYALLPGGERLLVLDDITEVVSAQRSAAWAEVARRLAHEIRNPLTPIQLSAERLKYRLEDKLAGAEQALLLKSVHTIVAQVQAMQTLVNEFRDYARLPAAQLQPLDLNALATDVLALYGQAADAGRLALRLEPALPLVMGDASQLRQVVHNLVQNGLDAVAERPEGRVELETSTVRGDDGSLRWVRLAVADNGPGFADKVLKRAFEPYVTTKAKGTGLGLAVVKKIADEHGARLRLRNLHAGDDLAAPVVGARVSLSFSNFAAARAAAAASEAPLGADAGSAASAH